MPVTYFYCVFHHNEVHCGSLSCVVVVFPLANRIYIGLSPIFTVYFTIMRCIVAPYLVWLLCFFYLSGNVDKVISRGISYFWMFTVILAIVGSCIWVYKLWIGLIRFNVKKKSAKVKMYKAE